MGWESSDVVRFDLVTHIQGEKRTAKLKSAQSLLIIGLQKFAMNPSYSESWTGNLLMWLDQSLGPFFKVIQGEPNLKVLIACLLLVLKRFAI